MKKDLFLTILFDMGAVTIASAYGGGFGARLVLNYGDSSLDQEVGVVADDYDWRSSSDLASWEELEEHDLPRIIADGSQALLLRGICKWYLQYQERYAATTD